VGVSKFEGPSQTTHSLHTIHLPTNTPGHHRHTAHAIASGLPVVSRRLRRSLEKLHTRTGGGQAALSEAGNALLIIPIVTLIHPRRTNAVAAAHHPLRPNNSGSISVGEASVHSHLPLKANIIRVGQTERKAPGRQDLGLRTTRWPPVVHQQTHCLLGGIDHDQ
jgi:hypothetical protein